MDALVTPAQNSFYSPMYPESACHTVSLDMAILAACTNQSEDVVVESRHVAKGRKHSYSNYIHQGKPVCPRMFRFLHVVGTFRNLKVDIKNKCLGVQLTELHTRTYARTHTHTHVQLRTHTHIHVQLRTHILMHIHTHTLRPHTHHTYAHTHTHTHTHTLLRA